jgi:hypothetical protein
MSVSSSALAIPDSLLAKDATDLLREPAYKAPSAIDLITASPFPDFE